MGNYDSLSQLEPRTAKIQNGITFHSETCSIDSDRFTNLYWVELNKESAKFKLLFVDKPLPLREFQYSGHTILAGLNFGGFYLSDDGYIPNVPYYNLAVSNGNVKQLPSNSRCVLLTNNGNLDQKLLIAKGNVLIGKQILTWRGANIEGNTDLITYGMFNIDISKNPTKRFGRARETKNSSRFVTASKSEVLLGVIITDNQPRIAEISVTTLDLLKFNYIFRSRTYLITKIKKGDLVTNIEIDGDKYGIDTDVCSGSFTLGRNKEELDRNMRSELIYPSNGAPKPMDETYRKSWSVVLKRDSSYIFFINDAHPKVSNQNGLTVYELQELLLKKFDYNWAIVGDSGQSSKLIVVEDGKRNVYGNLHYINYTKGKPFWDGENGRPVSVGLFAYA